MTDDYDPDLDPVFVGHRLRFAGFPATPKAVHDRMATVGMVRFYQRNYLAGQLALAERAGDAVTAARLRQELDAVGPPVPTDRVPLLPLP